MTVFFLVVGMEIRREIHEGALSRLDQAILPVLAASGGVIVPALIYLSLNGDPARGHGWAVPTATDIAFAVGVLALLGRSIPVNVRVFLLALAIIDDIIAVLIIALFYTASLQLRRFRRRVDWRSRGVRLSADRDRFCARFTSCPALGLDGISM